MLISDPRRLLSAPPSPLLLPSWAGSGKRIVAAQRHIAHVPTALRRPRVLVACEFSGIVRDAFIARGFDAWSCDILPTEQRGPHIVNDVRNVLDWEWDLMIAHPPCTHLAVSGAAWFKYKQHEQIEALNFIRLLMNAPIERIAIENPVGVISSRIRKPDQIIHPYQFGHTERKTTCLWLKHLPPLFPVRVMAERNETLHRLPPSKDRWKLRSTTFSGIADAMAAQWGRVLFAP